MSDNENENNYSYMKEWYKNNKKKHLDYLKTKITCKCGLEITRNNYNKHIKTKKHLNRLEDENDEKDELREKIDNLEKIINEMRNN